MKINYPNPTISNKKTSSLNNRSHGMIFENELNVSNDFYRIRNIAIIYKKPTPIRIVKVDYPDRTKAKITEAYYQTPSTTDYNGIYKGKYIDYEAKETNNLTFSFKHIFPHQLEHLQNVDTMGGIAFVIIYFKTINEVIIIDIKSFMNKISEGIAGGKKSISHEEAKIIGKEVKQGYAPPLDYLKAIDELYNLI